VSETCDFQKPNLAAIDRKPLVCYVCPTVSCVCAFIEDVSFCAVRFFALRMKSQEAPEK
jgi:hypothetical protein